MFCLRFGSRGQLVHVVTHLETEEADVSHKSWGETKPGLKEE